MGIFMQGIIFLVGYRIYDKLANQKPVRNIRPLLDIKFSHLLKVFFPTIDISINYYVKLTRFYIQLHII